MKNIKAERELALDFLRVTEAAAIESAKTMGQGDRKHSDHVAVEAMREVMDTVPMRGRIVIGEGERDEAPKSTSPSIRSKAQIYVLSAQTMRSRSSRLPSAAAF